MCILAPLLILILDFISRLDLACIISRMYIDFNLLNNIVHFGTGIDVKLNEE